MTNDPTKPMGPESKRGARAVPSPDRVSHRVRVRVVGVPGYRLTRLDGDDSRPEGVILCGDVSAAADIECIVTGARSVGVADSDDAVDCADRHTRDKHAAGVDRERSSDPADRDAVHTDEMGTLDRDIHTDRSE